MKLLLAILLFVATTASAVTTTTTIPCNPAVTNTVYSDGLETMPDKYCHWNNPHNNSINALHSSVCWKTRGNTLVSGSTWDATAASSTGMCKTASSNPATCTTDKHCYINTTDHLLYWCTATNTWTAVASSNTYTTVQDETTPLAAERTLNFTGAGVSCADNSGAGSTDCTVPNIYSTIQNEGSALTQRPAANFIGSQVSCTDNSGASRTDCTITSTLSPGGSAGDLQQNSGGTADVGYAGSTCSSDCVQSIGVDGTTTCDTCGSTGSGYDLIKDEGTSRTARRILNFTGAGVTCADNSGSSRTDCTIPAPYSTIKEEGSSLTTRPKVNFIGTAMTCVDNSGSSRTDCTLTMPSFPFEMPGDAVPGSSQTFDDEFNDNSFSGWTNVNDSENGSTCTKTETGSAYVDIVCTKRTSGTYAMHMWTKTAPSPPYNITARLNSAQYEAVPQSYTNAGIGLRNSSNGRTILCGHYYGGQYNYSLSRWTVNSGSSSVSATVAEQNWWRGPMPVQYWKMHVTSTNMDCYHSQSADGPWQYTGSETFSSFLTQSGGSVNEAGFILEVENSNTGSEMIVYFIRSDV